MQTLQQLKNGELKGVTALKLSEGLNKFPMEIFELAETLESLDLSKNNLKDLPANFGLLKKLKTFFCSENNFSHLPEVLADCPLLDIVGFKSNKIDKVSPRSINSNLRWLILTNNNINEIPSTIGDCSRMQKLMLAGNRLKTLPEELSKCQNLALLRISANQLSALPEWLLKMPKLAWLAFSGNPFVKPLQVTPLKLLEWSRIKLNHILGQGASGVIYHATLPAEEAKDIAVKLFKGEVTSDGLPEDEMNTCITAGLHPGLIKLLGQISNHPEQKKGLVMELIPANYYNLGEPPSLESCTRDIFLENFSLTSGQALKIATTIASVAAQLHSRNIMHGDLYAHNILIDQDCNTLFSDFGAASIYENPSLELIEVRAFGYLLADLIHLSRAESHTAVARKLQAVQTDCLQHSIDLRPQFQSIVHQLS
ncbi:MAG: protein kinase [Pedobacter sp.]|nr:MAG: protein kinase [Pedobacter sp.]